MDVGYKWRPDGNYMIRKTCGYCGESFDVHAMSNVRVDALFDLKTTCDACRQVRKWMSEPAPGDSGATKESE